MTNASDVPDENRQIPIVAVTGTNGKTTTARMVAHIMRAAGRNVGLTTSDGAYINETQIASGDMAGPRSAREILDDPRVDFAVLETARGGMLRAGLAFEQCAVGVVTNVAADHLGLKGVNTLEDLARVKARIPAAVAPDGTSVLNADNPWTVGMAPNAGGEVIYFGMDADNPVVLEHLRAHGRAVVLRPASDREVLTLLEADRATEVMAADEVPATMGGRVRVNIANSLAACAAAIGLGIDRSIIRAALQTFTSDFSQTPGRFNLITVEERQVLLDYAHNVDGLMAIAEFVRRTRAPQAVAVIAIAGDRRDEDIREFGALAARTFDRIVIREHDDRRGRAVGEVAEILRQTITALGVCQDRVKVVLDEEDAIHAAIDWANPGDLVVALVYRIERAWQIVTERASRTIPPPP